MIKSLRLKLKTSPNTSSFEWNFDYKRIVTHIVTMTVCRNYNNLFIELQTYKDVFKLGLQVSLILNIT